MLAKLIKSNFKNDFSHMITFFLIMVLSVFLFHSGIMIFVGYSNVHKEKVKEYNWSDVMVISALKDSDMEKIEEIISTSDVIESYEKQYPIYMDFTLERGAAVEGESKNAFDTSKQGLYILPYGEWGEIDAPHFSEISDEEYENPIYLSIYMNTNTFKLKLGDSVDLMVNDKYYTFQVAGFYEGILSNGLGLTYVKPSLYEEWKHDKEEAYNNKIRQMQEKDSTVEALTFTLFNMKVTEGTDPMEAAAQLSRAFDEHDITAVAQGVDEFITVFKLMQNMIAAMLMAFALIIAGISMIIIYFRISNSIEQNIVNIGAIKALGYTSSQIRRSMIIEFTLTSMVAFITGIIGSYLVMPTFEYMMRSQSAIVWDHAFDPVSFLCTFILIIGTVVVVSTISTKNIKKLDPVIALRFGINDHSFKKNRAPIERTPGPLTWIMALKSLIGNTKQNLILFVVTLSIGMVTTFSAFIAYNCVYDPMQLYRLLNLETGDVMFSMNNDDIGTYNDVKAIPEVEAMWWVDNAQFNVGGYSVVGVITEDWDDVPDVNILEGRSPKYDNEIALGGVIADTLGVGIGDEVTVTYGTTEKRYIITGIEQYSNQMGKDLSMTVDGARHLGYEARISVYEVNVKDHSVDNARKVVEKADTMLGDKLGSYLNVVEALSSGSIDIVAIAGAMVFAIVLISILVIILSMNLLVKTLIIKKQKEIGIKKALGFSSNQLRTELVLSMLPQIALGAAAGAVIGLMYSNKILAGLLVSVGVLRSNMLIFPWMGIVAVIFAVVVSFVIIWMISARIKRISAYSLITE
ncbi:MAG: FtsX-like permease family protein [Eubacterium sp.]|nr:FtsX-like permease family protein [Eubacterium sp.]